MRICVVSTGLNAPTAGRCRHSVMMQDRPDGVILEHHYIEASYQAEPRPNALENRYNIVKSLDPSDIVAEVDGDDWLAHPGVVMKLAEAYMRPEVWLTFGSYARSTDPQKREDWVQPYRPGESYRTSPWRASHLKTYRAALFQKIRPESFQGAPRRFGEKPVPFSDHVHDMTTMLPMLEMAGSPITPLVDQRTGSMMVSEHALFFPDVLYIYNLGTSWEWNATVSQKGYEKKCKAYLQAQDPYAKIEAL